MENLILGLLMLTPMTGYELQRFIKTNLSLICSASAGSIQTALSKLQRREEITFREQTEGKRHKKVFEITEAGRRAFAGWVAQPMQADRAKNMELSRLFFMGLARPEERRAAVEGYLRQVEEIRKVLCGLRENFRQARQGGLPPGRDWQEIFRFQEYTLEYGIAAAEFECSWYQHLLQEWEEEN